MRIISALASLAISLSVTGATPAAELTDGTIKKIDAAQKKITIKHGELKELEMPPMTMVFAAGEKVDLAKLKEGQKVKFIALRVNGRITVTEVK